MTLTRPVSYCFSQSAYHSYPPTYAHSRMEHYFFSYLLTCVVYLIEVLEIMAQMLQYITFFKPESHGLRTPREEIAFTARPKIQSQSQIFRYGQSRFCLPHRPTFSDIFDLCLHWVSVVRALTERVLKSVISLELN